MSFSIKGIIKFLTILSIIITLLISCLLYTSDAADD